MRYSLLFAIAILFLTACKKDKYTTAPQIEFVKIEPDAVASGALTADPVLTINITDAEGDIGFHGKDTAFIYMKNLLTNDFDSLPFPDLKDITKNNFQADVDITITKVLKCKSLPGLPLHTDILYFEVYIKDFAKNKSNVIKTDKPVYYTCR